MKFNYTIIYVDDVSETSAFYERIFGFKIRFVHESKMYAELETGETTLAFASKEMMKGHLGFDALNGRKNCFEIAFSTENVEEAFSNAISGGAKLLSEPEKKPWGQTVAYVEDPFGIIVELCTPM